MKLIINIDEDFYKKIIEEGVALDYFAMGEIIKNGIVLSEDEQDDITFKDDDTVSRLSVRDIIYANAYEEEYVDSSSEYVVNRDELIKYLMELPPVYSKNKTKQKLQNKTYLTMRKTTPEEQEAINKAIRDMSYNTGVTFEGLCNHETYVSMSKINDMIAKIEQVAEEEKFFDSKWALGLKYSVKIINKYTKEHEGQWE